MPRHIIEGEFQSDKYPWCQRGFVPLKLTDPMAQPLLFAYAQIRRSRDWAFAEDLIKCLQAAGFPPSSEAAQGDDAPAPSASMDEQATASAQTDAGSDESIHHEASAEIDHQPAGDGQSDANDQEARSDAPTTQTAPAVQPTSLLGG